MDLTKIKLKTSDITKCEFEGVSSTEQEASSGFIKIRFERQQAGDLNQNDLSMFFKGSIAAYIGEETPELDESKKVFSLKIEFVLIYSGDFDIETIHGEVSKENEWFFNKDASITLHSFSNRFLSNTAYRSINLPLQE
jgi:hypothetical protein